MRDDRSTVSRRKFVKLVSGAAPLAAIGVLRARHRRVDAQSDTAPGPDAAERDLALAALDAARSAGRPLRRRPHRPRAVRIDWHARATDHERQEERVVRHRRPRVCRRIVGLCRDTRRHSRRRHSGRARSRRDRGGQRPHRSEPTSGWPRSDKVPDGRWITPHLVDPFSVSLESKAELLFRINEEALKVKGVRFVTSSVDVAEGEPAARHDRGLGHPADVHPRQPECQRDGGGRGQLATRRRAAARSRRRAWAGSM